MTNKLSFALLGLALAVAVATPADAANKEQQQMMADIRMLQEQSQQLQNLIASLTASVAGSLTDGLKAVNARMDDQSNANRKTVADQKLVIDSLSNDVRVIREKLDDNNVRIGSLTQEVSALRQSLQQTAAARSSTAPVSDSTANSDATAGTTAGATPLPVGMSPQKLYDSAWSDYISGQYDLAIQGFDMYIKTFPKSDSADNAQVNIGNSYLQDGKPDKAVEAYDKTIRTYPGSYAVPEAYFKKGLALQSLKDLDGARAAWEYAVKNFPDSDAGRLSKQRLDQLKKP
jgi:tol-pal system protein YbgF